MQEVGVSLSPKTWRVPSAQCLMKGWCCACIGKQSLGDQGSGTGQGSGEDLLQELANGGKRHLLNPKSCALLCLVAQLCPTLFDSMDCSPPGSSVHGDSPSKNTGVGCHSLLQGIFPTQGSNPGVLHCRHILYHLSHQGSPRILEWVGYPFSRESA